MFPSSFPLSLILLLDQLSLPYHPRLKTNHVYNNVLSSGSHSILPRFSLVLLVYQAAAIFQDLVGPPRLTPLLTTSLTVIKTTVPWKTEKAPDLVSCTHR